MERNSNNCIALENSNMINSSSNENIKESEERRKRQNERERHNFKINGMTTNYWKRIPMEDSIKKLIRKGRKDNKTLWSARIEKEEKTISKEQRKITSKKSKKKKDVEVDPEKVRIERLKREASKVVFWTRCNFKKDNNRRLPTIASSVRITATTPATKDEIMSEIPSVVFWTRYNFMIRSDSVSSNISSISATTATPQQEAIDNGLSSPLCSDNGNNITSPSTVAKQRLLQEDSDDVSLRPEEDGKNDSLQPSSTPTQIILNDSFSVNVKESSLCDKEVGRLKGTTDKDCKLTNKDTSDSGSTYSETEMLSMDDFSFTVVSNNNNNDIVEKESNDINDTVDDNDNDDNQSTCSLDVSEAAVSIASSVKSVAFKDQFEINYISLLSNSIAEEIFWTEEELAEFKYQAFMEECGLDPADYD